MKQAFALLLAIVACGFGAAWAEIGVPVARDLQKDAELAKKKNGVVLVMFAGEHCSYCETVLNEFLIPMSRNADYQSKLVMRKVELSSYQPMKDFLRRQDAASPLCRRQGSAHGADRDGVRFVRQAAGQAGGRSGHHRLLRLSPRSGHRQLAKVRGLPEPK
jgi:hypothetical protein